MQIVDGVMYAILDYDVYAFRTSDGALLWHIGTPDSQSHSKNLSCQITGSRIYILHRDGTFAALDTKNGTQLWRSAVILTDSMLFEVQHGSIYSEQNIGTTPRLSALDTTTGKERWHVDLQEGNTMSPTLVAGGIVYHTTSNILYALDEATGHILWQQHTDNPAIFFSLASIASGILYADTATIDPLVGGECNGSHPALVCQPNTYHVYAFDARNGTLRWKSAAGLHLYNNNSLYSNDSNQPAQPALQVINGTVLTYQLHSTALTLHALDATGGNQRWQTDVQCSADSCGPFPTALNGNTITLIDDNYQAKSIRLLSLDLASGRQIAQHTLSFQNQGRPIDFVGLDNGRLYLLAKGDEHALDIIHGLSLVNGTDLWRHQVDNYGSGSIEEPIIAP